MPERFDAKYKHIYRIQNTLIVDRIEQMKRNLWFCLSVSIALLFRQK